jgi:trehalose 6-phosphate synthase
VVAVANRLPVQRTAAGWTLSPGGLVAALRPVMEQRTGSWVGWDGGTRGTPDRLPEIATQLRPVRLRPGEIDAFYLGFSNRTLWPLLHNAIQRPVFDRSWWPPYRDVNDRFAAAAVDAASGSDATIWVHDYHLMLVPAGVRAARPTDPLGFFLHVPWPAPEIFARLPWRVEVLEGLLGADVVSFHTETYRRNFTASCARILAHRGVSVSGSTITTGDGRQVRTTASPISIDADELADIATTAAATADVDALREQFSGRSLILGVDRLDYTKGIVERLLAFERLLEDDDSLAERVVLVQIAVPSRDDVAEYKQLRETVEGVVGRINGRFTQPHGDVPVHYLYQGLPPERLVAYYRAADVMAVTPLIDGMNLVAKEFVVCQHAVGGDGALVLSEFTGAAAELREAMACNPFDIDGLAGQFRHALELAPDRRRRAIRAMGRRIRHNDVHAWLRSQLDAIEPGCEHTTD